MDVKITEKLVFSYGNPEKKCTIERDVVNRTTDGAKVGYKKTTKISGQKPGFQLLIQNLKDGVYFSQSNVHKPFVFDSKLDKLPKSVVGNDKNNQKTYYTKQPSFFKNLYLKFGFKPIHVRKKYYNYTDDAIVMEFC